MKPLVASGMVLSGTIAYAAIPIITKFALSQGFSPNEIVSGQVTVGFLLMSLLAIPSIKKLKGVSKKRLGILTASGALWGLMEVFIVLTLDRKVPASIAVVLFAQYTWMGWLVQWFRKRIPLSKVQWFSLGGLILGTICVSGLKMADVRELDMTGVVFGICAAASCTAALLVSETIAVELPTVLRSTFGLIGQVIFTYCIFPPTFLFSGSLGNGLWIWIGVLGLIVLIDVFCYNKALPVISTGKAATIMAIELPAGVILSTLVLKESLSFVQWFGVALIFGSVLYSELKTSAKG